MNLPTYPSPKSGRTVKAKGAARHPGIQHNKQRALKGRTEQSHSTSSSLRRNTAEGYLQLQRTTLYNSFKPLFRLDQPLSCCL